jgi:hypothetical protein
VYAEFGITSRQQPRLAWNAGEECLDVGGEPGA